MMWIELSDGRTLGVPLAWFPRLLRAALAEREQVDISRVGLHWDALDEDISIAGLLAGRGDVTPGELACIDRGLSAAAEGRFANEQEIEAAFTKFRAGRIEPKA
jgi:uncharacterized protein DUF2442